MKNKNQKQEEVTPMNGSQQFSVTGATITDEICNYSIHVTHGTGIGKHGVKGEGIVDEDMKIAFSRFNVHLAIADGVFKHKGIAIDKVNKFHNDETVADYLVTGFKMSGEEDNLTIVLSGSKHVALGQIKFDTPKIILDAGGGYEFYKELKQSAEKAIEEVELYIGGKFTPIEKPETSNPNQTNILKQIEEKTGLKVTASE